MGGIEGRNPLEVVEEALALVEWEGEFVPGGNGVNIPTCLVCGHHPAEGHAKSCEVRAALALVRKIRADAVVGWMVVEDDCPLFSAMKPPEAMRNEFPGDYVLALLLPLPDSTEPSDVD
jgi:hypothetical protein